MTILFFFRNILILWIWRFRIMIKTHNFVFQIDIIQIFHILSKLRRWKTNSVWWKEFIDLYRFFSIPALSQSLNIQIRQPPPVNWMDVENYMNSNDFKDFDSLVSGIKNNFQSDMDNICFILLHRSPYFIWRKRLQRRAIDWFYF